MSITATQILTPVGRLVAGSPFEPNTTDMDGRPLVVKSGANVGQPRTEYFLAIAVPKSDPGVSAVYQQIMAVARQGFPTLFDAAGKCLRPDFAFKITDGDSQVPDLKNRRPCDREGYAGCWIFKFKNGFAPKVYSKGGASIITNPAEVKPGYFIRVYGTAAANDNATKPGVYLNCSMIELVGYGEEITFGPSGDQIFGAAPAALPVGASATPLAPRTPLAGPGLPPITPALPPNVTPAPDFLTPPPPPPAAPAPAPEEFFIAPNGARVARSALVGAGWNDTQIATLKRG
jgi:hypothetical protein